MGKYFGSFSDLENVLRNFADGDGFSSRQSLEEVIANGYKPDDIIPTEDEVLFASYGAEGYQGDATVFFEKGGKLYENSGSHCSCNGLEGQWGPSEVTWEALALRLAKDSWFLSSHDESAREAFAALVKSRLTEDEIAKAIGFAKGQR